jgi:hypothetical protein
MRVPKLERLIDRAECMAAESAENGFVCTAMDLRAFAAALGAFLPEERVGRCWCETFVWGEWRAEQFGWEIIPAADPSTEDTPRWCNDANIEHDCKFCFDCGAHLGTDGIARRNAAVRQVQRVLEALDEVEQYKVGDDTMDDSFDYKHGAAEAAQIIRAALDPQGGADHD